LIEGETPIDLVLYKEGEFAQAGTGSTTPQATSEPGTEGFIFGNGVEEHENCRVLMMFRIISSCEEIASIEPVDRSGTGWTTYVRSGTAIRTEETNYINEPFWRVTFKEERADGLEEVFVQRVCGNVSAPPGKEVPSTTPTPTSVTTPTPPVGTSTPPPTATPPAPPSCEVTILGLQRLDSTSTHARMQASIQWDRWPNFAETIKWYLDSDLVGGGESVVFMAELNEDHLLLVRVTTAGGQLICDDVASFAEGSIPPGSDIPGSPPISTETPIPSNPGPSPTPNDDGWQGP
jgi:hypothetical protein